MEKTYCIINTKVKDELTNEDLFWNNDFGWVTDHFDIFNEEEKNKFFLPVDGEWKEYT